MDSENQPTDSTTQYHPSQVFELEDQLILVDENDGIQGKISKQDAHKNVLNLVNPHHRAFSLFLLNKDNKLLMHQRSSKKITYPLCWTNSCCSHPLYTGDEMIEKDMIGVKNAMKRRAMVELGLDLKKIELKDFHFMGKYKYSFPYDAVWGEKEVDYCFILQGDFPEEIPFNKNEVEDIKWISKDEIFEFIEAKKPNVSPWFMAISNQALLEWMVMIARGEISSYEAPLIVRDITNDQDLFLHSS